MSGREWMVRRWSGEGGATGRALDLALVPAEWLFRQGVDARNAAYDRGWCRVARAPIPVVSVGNLAVGGAGKTPFAAWVAARLAEWGHRPALALSGYAWDEIAVHRELNARIPVYAARRRIEAARRAAAEGAEVLVLDDGLQHRALARDLEIALVAAEGWGVRRRLLPRGPWREGPAALRRADVLVVTRKSASAAEAARLLGEVGEAAPGLPRVECLLEAGELEPLHAGVESELPPRGAALLAVAAVAGPALFAAQLRERGYRVELAAFPDHHPYSERDAAAILDRAAGRPVVVTLKDAVKLRPLMPTARVLVLRQRVRILGGGEGLDAALRRTLSGGTG